VSTPVALSGSYRPDEAEGGLAAELSRLRSQVELSWEEEARLLASAGVADRAAIVDLGSGPGFFADRLLARFPGSRVTSVEIRLDLHAEAVRRHQDGNAGSRLALVHAPVLASGLPAASFDAVVARYLLQHVADPVAVAREAHRLLRPGGLFIAIDVDASLWGVSDPFARELQPIYAKAERLQVERGGDRFIGRKLPRILESAGFGPPRVDVFAYHSDALGLAAFAEQLSPSRLVPAVHAGIVSRAEHDLVTAEYERFMADQMSFVLMLGFFVHARRSG
jgi:SAM-dependent methyltransferase